MPGHFFKYMQQAVRAGHGVHFQPAGNRLTNQYRETLTYWLLPVIRTTTWTEVQPKASLDTIWLRVIQAAY